MKVQIRVEYWGRNRFVVLVLKDGVTLEHSSPRRTRRSRRARTGHASAGASWVTRSRRKSYRTPGTCAARGLKTWRAGEERNETRSHLGLQIL
jgi:hypothetical protein